MACAHGNQHCCRECEQFKLTKYLHESDDFDKNDNMCLLQKSPERPLMVYERASVFLEQFHENRKQLMQNIRKLDSDYIHDHGGRDIWAPKCSHYNLNLSRSSSFADTNQKKFNLKNDSKLHIEMKNNNDEILDSDLDLPTPKSKMLCGKNSSNDFDDSLRKAIESSMALEKTLSSSSKKQNDELNISVLVFLALLYLVFIGKIIDRIQIVLDYMKEKLASYIMKLWKIWDMSSLVKRKECAKVTLICFSPVMAVIGALYSCVWIAYTINKTIQSPVPDRLVKKLNFKRLLEEDSL